MPTIKDLDKDGDGKLSREEAPEPMQQFFDVMDGNSDGFVDAAEMAEARNRMRAAGGPPGAGGGGGGRPEGTP
jgi:Ca2+-binding EF-hand superfamily protein